MQKSKNNTLNGQLSLDTETVATPGKMTDVATGESLPITTVSTNTKITQNSLGVNSHSMQKSQNNSENGQLSNDTETVDETAPADATAKGNARKEQVMAGV